MQNLFSEGLFIRLVGQRDATGETFGSKTTTKAPKDLHGARGWGGE